jgi:hypothetical protein
VLKRKLFPAEVRQPKTWFSADLRRFAAAAAIGPLFRFPCGNLENIWSGNEKLASDSEGGSGLKFVGFLQGAHRHLVASGYGGQRVA